MTGSSRSALVASGLSKFAYRIDAADGTPLAHLRMPTWPSTARNSGLRFGGRDYVEIEADGKAFRLEYETFDARGLAAPGYRYFLMDGTQALATATRARGRHPWAVDGVGGRYEWAPRRRFMGLHFELTDAGRVAGEAVETTRFLRLRRTYGLSLPASLGLPTQAFLFFLAVNATYR